MKSNTISILPIWQVTSYKINFEKKCDPKWSLRLGYLMIHYDFNVFIENGNILFVDCYKNDKLLRIIFQKKFEYFQTHFILRQYL